MLKKTYPVLLGFGLFIAGCSPSVVKIDGKLLKDGQPYPGSRVKVIFYPDTGGGEKPDNFYRSRVWEDGSFTTLGRSGKGIPAGTYRIAVEGAEGELGTSNSPIVRELISNDDIVIDVSKPEG